VSHKVVVLQGGAKRERERSTSLVGSGKSGGDRSDEHVGCVSGECVRAVPRYSGLVGQSHVLGFLVGDCRPPAKVLLLGWLLN